MILQQPHLISHQPEWQQHQEEECQQQEADQEAEVKSAGRPTVDADDDYMECVEPSEDIKESGGRVD